MIENEKEQGPSNPGREKAKGKAKGKANGLAKGKAKGRANGRIESAEESLDTLLKWPSNILMPMAIKQIEKLSEELR